MAVINIGILGLGTVGSGVMNIFQENRERIREYTGVDIQTKKVLVRNMSKPRDTFFENGTLTADPQEVLNDPEIDIIVELMGGIEPAFSYVLQAIENGKHIVTANKALIATHYEELFKTASQNGVEIRFEGSVGGGIPVIDTITARLAGNRIDEIVGIINGTTNYILTRMSKDGMGFEEALKLAQDKGFAEADPTSDLNGQDVSFKLAILAAISFGIGIEQKDIPYEGITKIAEDEISYAMESGYTVKLLATARKREDKLEIYVHPTLIPNHHPLAAVSNEFNALFIRGNAVGELMLYGKGAGSLPTGSAVVGDILDIVKLKRKSAKTGSRPIANKEDLRIIGEDTGSYYIRLQVIDEPGVLGAITTVLGKNGISIASVSQQALGQKDVPVIFVTHKVKREKLDKGLEELRELKDIVKEVACILRVEGY
ncbi:MAG: homoserine dehydrogenase [Clostridiales bacterium]|nr:homoserine dehydrogenase [Clostridiales bacterium]